MAGQVYLQGIGAAVVRDESSPHIDRHDEDDEVLLPQELAERLPRRRDHRELGIVRGEIDLHRPNHERHPRSHQQPQEHPLAQHRHHAGARDHQPGLPERPAPAAVSSITLVVYRHNFEA
jgi:hypothetical protein